MRSHIRSHMAEEMKGEQARQTSFPSASANESEKDEQPTEKFRSCFEIDVELLLILTERFRTGAAPQLPRIHAGDASRSMIFQRAGCSRREKRSITWHGRHILR